MEPTSDFQRRIGVGERQHRFGRHAGTARTSAVRNELTGGVAGSTTEHWSGRVDATVRPDAVRITKEMQR